jgi:hypothetical protein
MIAIIMIVIGFLVGWLAWPNHKKISEELENGMTVFLTGLEHPELSAETIKASAHQFMLSVMGKK